MKQWTFRRERRPGRKVPSELCIILAAFAKDLRKRGYHKHTSSSYVGVAIHFGRWLKSRRYNLRNVKEGLVEEFCRKHLPHCRCPRPADVRGQVVRPGLRHLLEWLRTRKLCPPAPEAVSLLVRHQLRDFALYLREVRGLAEQTCRYHQRHIGEFLKWRFQKGPLSYERLRPQDFAEFLDLRAQQLCPKTMQLVAGSLRTFLRYLQLEGKVRPGLERAVLTPAAYGRESLPKIFTEEERRLLLHRGFDRQSAIGRRDYAMALCQLELGLRACEVAGLTLDDIDWREGVVVIRKTKTRRERILPIPKRVGRAVSVYLQYGRPQSTAREVFVRHIRPVGSALVSGSVRAAMREAYWRAGLPHSWTGTHVLRRTFATRLHGHGAGLKAIADLLGHQSLNTTTVYTGVNLAQLRQVALPWPK